MAQRILYFLTTGTNISPFDVTIAADSGFDQVIPLTNIDPKSVAGVVQDAIFCRPPKRFNDTGIFIGGRDVHLATDMFLAAQRAMVGDFQVGVFADPNGAYTTSASIVALLERAMIEQTGSGLDGKTVAVFGTGPVGLCTAVLAARQNAHVKVCQLMADDNARIAIRFAERYETKIEWVNAETYRNKVAILAESDAAICAAKAGVRILDREMLDTTDRLKVVADSNAVPPSGIDGLGVSDRNAVLEFARAQVLGIGPLTIGNLKYKTQFGLFRQLLTSEQVALLDFPQAYSYALEEIHRTKPAAAA